MNQNTKEALILELTKAKVGKQHIDNPTNTNLTKAEFWIESYLEAEKEIEEAVDRLIPENNLKLRAFRKPFKVGKTVNHYYA